MTGMTIGTDAVQVHDVHQTDDAHTGSALAPIATVRRDIVTAALSTWLVGGVLADGWAHEHVKLESFITPWHAVLYAGFLALAGWVGWVGLHTAVRRAGARTPFVFPAGYSLAAVGAVVFWLSGIADFAWHTAFGIESGDAALLSPSHLGLLCGGVMLTTTPIRSAWHRCERGGRLSFTALWSATLTTFTVSFLLHEDDAFWDNPISKGHRDAVRASTYQSSRYIQHVDIGAIVGSVIITTLVLFVPLIAIATRWRLTVLTCGFILGFPALAIGGIQGFRDPGLAILGVAAGLIAGGVIELSMRLPQRSRHAVSLAIGAIAFWSTYVGGIALGDHGLGVKAEIWGGLIVWSALITLALALLALNPDAAIGIPNNTARCTVNLADEVGSDR
jgi:hypothetical protein